MRGLAGKILLGGLRRCSLVVSTCIAFASRCDVVIKLDLAAKISGIIVFHAYIHYPDYSSLVRG
jgi:hypothetical protein